MSESAGVKQRAKLEQQQESAATTKQMIMTNRKGYACLDIGSMGVDVKENFE